MNFGLEAVKMEIEDEYELLKTTKKEAEQIVQFLISFHNLKNEFDWEE